MVAQVIDTSLDVQESFKAVSLAILLWLTRGLMSRIYLLFAYLAEVSYEQL